MRKRLHVVTVLCLLALGALSAAGAAMAAGPERYLHVKVEDGEKGESVNVNVPLSMAEKILPTINNGDLHAGRVTLHKSEINGVDIRTILDALHNAADNEFVTVKENGVDKVRVAKSGGNIVIHVKDREGRDEGKEQKVDVTVPMKVVDALFATAKDDELDVAAALRALSDAGDILLVTVQDAQQKVRVWVDSRSTAE
jgi:hypothetical protein